jgi:putative PIN family toxin of toxin-antitoxin system
VAEFRAVLDSNELVSALICPRGIPAQLVQRWIRSQFTLVTSPYILDELERVLRLPRIRRRYPVTDGEILRFVHLVGLKAVLVGDPAPVSLSFADPNDLPILACAVEGRADSLVSGDHRLLELKRFRHVRILSAREFLGLLDSPA